MTSEPSKIERINEMDADRERIVTISQKLSKPVIVRLRADLIRAYRAGDSPSKAFKVAKREVSKLIQDGMLASHVAATARAVELIERIRGTKLDRTGFSPMLDRLKKAAKLTNANLDAIRSRYAVTANDTSEEAFAFAQEAIGENARKIAAQGLSTKDGIAELRDAMDRAGLPAQNPRLLETVYRTEFQTAYSEARLQANEAQEINEILWGYEYVTVGDDRVRPTHMALDGARFAKDDPKWKELAPPNGYNCRCSFVEILEFDSKELRTVNPPPASIEVGGVKTPVRPDDGFDFNPADIGR